MKDNQINDMVARVNQATDDNLRETLLRKLIKMRAEKKKAEQSEPHPS